LMFDEMKKIPLCLTLLPFLLGIIFQTGLAFLHTSFFSISIDKKDEFFHSESNFAYVHTPNTPNESDNGNTKYDILLSSGFLAFGRHIGFLKALEECVGREKVSKIVGTSSGAFIGAMWSAGYSADEISGLISSKRPFQLLRPAFRFWRGAISFGPLIKYLDRDIDKLPANIESLRIPTYLGVTTMDKQNVLLNSGPVARGVAASCAVPGIFSSVEVNGILYQDGGVSDRLALTSWLELDDRTSDIIIHIIEPKVSSDKSVPINEAYTLDENKVSAVCVTSKSSEANLFSFKNLDHEVNESYIQSLQTLKQMLVANKS